MTTRVSSSSSSSSGLPLVVASVPSVGETECGSSCQEQEPQQFCISKPESLPPPAVLLEVLVAGLVVLGVLAGLTTAIYQQRDGFLPMAHAAFAPTARLAAVRTRHPSLINMAGTTNNVETEASTTTTTSVPPGEHWKIGPTPLYPQARPLTPELQRAVSEGVHPMESQEELGKGVYVVDDWRRAWYTYASPPEFPDLIDPWTGEARYDITDVEGEVPDDLEGILYRNGPGNFGFDGERVQHVLDADGLILRIAFLPAKEDGSPRRITFRSKLIETEWFQKEREAQEFLFRGVFGTARRGLPWLFGEGPRRGLNAEPSNPPLLSRIAGNFGETSIKNTANTQVISFGGKLLALFEAGWPHALDPLTLETLGQDDLGGVLQAGLPVSLEGVPEEWTPEMLGGTAHTTHPHMCPRTGHMVGWHWSQSLPSRNLCLTLTEWTPENFTPVASSQVVLEGCDLAPHDFVITDDCAIFIVNSLEMDRVPFMGGWKGPAPSLKMKGHEDIVAHIVPRPTSPNQFEPFQVTLPAAFVIHFSHAYQDDATGNIVLYFAGWPPSDATDFLGAWGGFCPVFDQIPPTFLWRVEIDTKRQECKSLKVAPGCANVCAEFVMPHPNFSTRPARNVYAAVSNVVGDSSPPCGYARLRVQDGDTKVLQPGEPNENVDVYWFGTRCFTNEPLIVPKQSGNLEDEDDAYLVGMVDDAVRNRSGIAIFDLQRPLREGPVSMLWLKSLIPHGLHGCFAPQGGAGDAESCIIS